MRVLQPDSTATLLIEHAAELATVTAPGIIGPRAGPNQAELGLIPDGAVAVGMAGRILAVGTTAEVREAVSVGPGTRVIDASGRAVLPGLVDPHTHAVFAGDRAGEFALRLRGAEYLEILAWGGGILNTVRATRATSERALVTQALRRLDQMLLLGTTTIEIKSGYGLTTEEEIKLLRAIRALAEIGPQTIVSTFLGAHAVPPEFRDRPDGYVDLICQEMIPLVASEELARYCDVFCERGIFTVDQSRRVLETAAKHGLELKLHAEQKTHAGGAALAAELRAVSVSHLQRATDDDLELLAEAGTIGLLLPGVPFMLRDRYAAPARRMIDVGLPIALGTGFNPGTCPIMSIPVVLGLACLELDLSPAEALVAATINAAHAIGLGDEIGSLEPGKRADILILDGSSHVHLPYHFAANLVHTVVKDGWVVVEGGRRVA